MMVRREVSTGKEEEPGGAQLNARRARWHLIVSFQQAMATAAAPPAEASGPAAALPIRKDQSAAGAGGILTHGARKPPLASAVAGRIMRSQIAHLILWDDMVLSWPRAADQATADGRRRCHPHHGVHPVGAPC